MVVRVSIRMGFRVLGSHVHTLHSEVHIYVNCSLELTINSLASSDMTVDHSKWSKLKLFWATLSGQYDG